MIVFDFLFYCLYRMFKLIKRNGIKDEELASSFYPILLSTNTMLIFFLLRYTDLSKVFLVPPFAYFLLIFLVLIFVIWNIVCKKYLVKKGNNIKIIQFYENKYTGSNNKMAFFGVLYTIMTFLIFIVLANFPKN